MIELSPQFPKEAIESRDIFNISEKTDTIIACIQGIDSSPKITNQLIDNGFDNFSCLSGGILGLTDYFSDHKTIIDISCHIAYSFDNSIKRRILKQSNCSQDQYYKKLTNKKIYIITHKMFINLDKTITGQNLYLNGVKDIFYFKEEKNLKIFLSKELETNL